MPHPEIEPLLAAAQANKGEAQYELGIAYLKGEGVSQDFVEAYFWLTLCSATPSAFWSPPPDELAAQAKSQISEEALAESINRVVLWVAEHGPPVGGDY